MPYGGGGGTASAGRGTGGRGVGSDYGGGYAGGGPTGGRGSDYGGASSATGGVGAGFAGNPGGTGNPGGRPGGVGTPGVGGGFHGGSGRGDFAGDFGALMGAIFGGGGGGSYDGGYENARGYSFGQDQGYSTMGVEAGVPSQIGSTKDQSRISSTGQSQRGKDVTTPGSFAGVGSGQSTRGKDPNSSVRANIDEAGHRGFRNSYSVSPTESHTRSGRSFDTGSRPQSTEKNQSRARPSPEFDTGSRPSGVSATRGGVPAEGGSRPPAPPAADPRAVIADVMDTVFAKLAQANDYYSGINDRMEHDYRNQGRGGTAGDLFQSVLPRAWWQTPAGGGNR